jgi:hypothetical protein
MKMSGLRRHSDSSSPGSYSKGGSLAASVSMETIFNGLESFPQKNPQMGLTRFILITLRIYIFSKNHERMYVFLIVE